MISLMSLRCNAMPIEGVKYLVEFMKKFEKENA